jgi:hypothetical protein
MYTDETWAAASEEEKLAEFERCQNPVYVYNTYFKAADMAPITESVFVEMMAIGRLRTFKPRRPDLWPSKKLLEEEMERVRKELGF